MKKLNEVATMDSFEVIDIEEKMDFVVIKASGIGCPCSYE